MYDPRCLEQNVAIRAIWLLWCRRSWDELEELHLGKEIQEPFDRYSLTIVGSRLRTDAQAQGLIASLDSELRAKVLKAANALNRTYADLYRKDIKTDEYTK